MKFDRCYSLISAAEKSIPEPFARLTPTIRQSIRFLDFYHTSRAYRLPHSKSRHDTKACNLEDKHLAEQLHLGILDCGRIVYPFHDGRRSAQYFKTAESFGDANRVGCYPIKKHRELQNRNTGV